MSHSDSDGSDWFEKDEDDILQDLQKKIVETPLQEKAGTEYLTKAASVAAAAEASAENVNLSVDAVAKATSGRYRPKISIDDLRKISQLVPLDIFLSAATNEPDFIAAPVTKRDSQDRVILYMRILASICSLDLPGFHMDYLGSFAQNDAFADHVCYMIERLFSQRYKLLWTDVVKVDQIIEDIQMLLLLSHQAVLLSPKWLETLRKIKRFVVESDAPAVAERKLCIEFRQHLEQTLVSDEGEKDEIKEITEKELEKKDESKDKHSSPSEPDSFYPTFEELQSAIRTPVTNRSIENPKRAIYKNASDYIVAQKRLLREDFMMPLRAYVRAFSDKEKEPSRLDLFIDDVHIVLNTKFYDAHRHEMIFVDVLGSRRSIKDVDANIAAAADKEVFKKLRRIKSGALLCFTSSREFENLILATVEFTDEACLKEGYLSIAIVRQYNIGNFYGQSLLMFETPAFLEPYRNVYDFLDTCGVANFPMEQYVVHGEASVKAPVYLKTGADYKLIDGKTCTVFNPLVPSSLPSNLFNLNNSQRAAFSSALTQELSLIQGPPGTGKTHLSVHLMKTLIDNAPQKPLVLITYSNESLDKFLLKLTMHTNSIIRFGQQSRRVELAAYNIREASIADQTNPRLKRLNYITNLEYKALFEKMQILLKNFDGTDDCYQEILTSQPAIRVMVRKLHTVRLLFQYYVARQKHVIAMTTTFAAKNNFLFRLLKSPIVIFEEAAEILESHVVACLTPFTQHVIMIGDHQQLRPYTSTNRMCVSLFERLIIRKLRPSILNVQYRMHPAISNLICPVIYKELHNAEGVVDKYPIVRTMRKNLFFLNHTEQETKSGNEFSVSNAFEIKQIRALAAHLIVEAGYLPRDLVILSPYARQIELIRKELKRDVKLQYIRAATVDSFQGLEANIVLLTLVRSNRDAQIGFLQESNRICVALSRAKHGMYIIGNMELLANCHKKWRMIFKKLQAQGSIGNKFPYEKEEEKTSINESENYIVEKENETVIREPDSSDEAEDYLNCYDNDEELLLNLLQRHHNKSNMYSGNN